MGFFIGIPGIPEASLLSMGAMRQRGGAVDAEDVLIRLWGALGMSVDIVDDWLVVWIFFFTFFPRILGVIPTDKVIFSEAWLNQQPDDGRWLVPGLYYPWKIGDYRSPWTENRVHNQPGGSRDIQCWKPLRCFLRWGPQSQWFPYCFNDYLVLHPRKWVSSPQWIQEDKRTSGYNNGRI